MAVAEPRYFARSRIARLAELRSHLLLLAVAACRGPAYVACPVNLDRPLPSDTFERCQQVLRQQGAGLAIAQRSPLRLQTGWTPVDDPPGERRMSVFLDDSVEPPGLAVVVELRWLQESWFGVPGWSEPRGDDVAERALAEALAVALRSER